MLRRNPNFMTRHDYANFLFIYNVTKKNARVQANRKTIFDTY